LRCREEEQVDEQLPFIIRRKVFLVEEGQEQQLPFIREEDGLFLSIRKLLFLFFFFP